MADIIERGRTQYDLVPCSFEMHVWFSHLRELNLRILWREYFGQVAVICLMPRPAFFLKSDLARDQCGGLHAAMATRGVGLDQGKSHGILG